MHKHMIPLLSVKAFFFLSSLQRHSRKCIIPQTPAKPKPKTSLLKNKIPK